MFLPAELKRWTKAFQFDMRCKVIGRDFYRGCEFLQGMYRSALCSQHFEYRSNYGHVFPVSCPLARMRFSVSCPLRISGHGKGSTWPQLLPYSKCCEQSALNFVKNLHPYKNLFPEFHGFNVHGISATLLRDHHRHRYAHFESYILHHCKSARFFRLRHGTVDLNRGHRYRYGIVLVHIVPWG